MKKQRKYQVWMHTEHTSDATAPMSLREAKEIVAHNRAAVRRSSGTFPPWPDFEILPANREPR